MEDETCGYCPLFQFGYCSYHDKARSADDEICAEIKAQGTGVVDAAIALANEEWEEVKVRLEKLL